jgi:hypothetical protein
MLTLNAGNVLLKPSHRRQLMSWLKRALKLSERLGNLAISITLTRVGKLVEMRAGVTRSGRTTEFRARESDWHYAARNLVRLLTGFLHNQTIQRAV